MQKSTKPILPKVSLLIRVDASNSIGLGHLIRCIGIAQELSSIGYTSIFLIKSYDVWYESLLSKCGFVTETMPRTYTFIEDAQKTVATLRKYKTKTLLKDITDDESLNHRDDLVNYFNTIIKGGFALTAIDDYNKLDFPFDIHVIPYYGAEKIPYRKFTQTTYLLGTKYFILKSDFKEFIYKKTISKEVKKILIAIGGKNPLEITKQIIQMLPNNKKRLFVKIVLGRNFKSAEIESLLREVNLKITAKVVSKDATMASLLDWADVAITGGGLTKYESAFMGTPNIIISQIPIEAERADLYCQSGAAVHLGKINVLRPDEITAQLKTLFMNVKKRSDMSRKSKLLIDGFGAQRIIAVLKERKLL